MSLINNNIHDNKIIAMWMKKWPAYVSLLIQFHCYEKTV